MFSDDRGTFFESWRRDRYEVAGIPGPFVQDNVATSRRGVVRGLHYQWPEPQGKLVMAVSGEVFDVAVDVRRGSQTLGQWYGHHLSADEGTQLWVPEGFAHGYEALSETATFAYKCTRAYRPDADHAVRWDDPVINVNWSVADPVLSAKDATAPRLDEILDEHLPYV